MKGLWFRFTVAVLHTTEILRFTQDDFLILTSLFNPGSDHRTNMVQPCGMRQFCYGMRVLQ